VLTLGRTGSLADLSVDLDGRYLESNETITLSGDVTGSGTTAITTTISAGAVDFAMINSAVVITETEGIANNDNDVTLPTSAAVKAYADSLIVGGLIYQGGYNAATNTPDLDSSPSSSIKKGWTYTVTTDGTFFTEQVRVGDVIIAEVDAPTTLANWTTVQNNIDLASATQIGIGNVEGGDGITVNYSNGTATVDLNKRSFTNTGPAVTGTTYTIDAATHGLGSCATCASIIMVQLVDETTGGTVFADVTRGTNGLITITFAESQTANSFRALLQKVSNQ
jgi:hypothetical protein